jgi:hypothetical protein
MRAVPHLNELQAKYGEQGLLIVGVSNEDEDKIRDKMESVGMEFAVARSAEGADQMYGVQSVPASFLIDRSGQLIWSGHPVGLTDELVERALQ